MSKFNIKCDDLVLFMKGFGFKMSSKVWEDKRFVGLEERIINSGKYFEILANKNEKNFNFLIKVSPFNFVIKNSGNEKSKDISREWRKYLHNVRGLEYDEFVKSVYEKEKKRVDFYASVIEEINENFNDEINEICF